MYSHGFLHCMLEGFSPAGRPRRGSRWQRLVQRARGRQHGQRRQAGVARVVLFSLPRFAHAESSVPWAAVLTNLRFPRLLIAQGFETWEIAVSGPGGHSSMPPTKAGQSGGRAGQVRAGHARAGGPGHMWRFTPGTAY